MRSVPMRRLPYLTLMLLAFASLLHFDSACAIAAAPSTSGTRAAKATTRAKSPATRPLSLTDSLRLDPTVHTGVLPNGIRWYAKQNHKPEHRVSIRLAVAAGSTAEDEDQRGLAHFAEHMNFNGSEHFGPDELVAYLRSIGLRFGADANAYTSFDETVYMLEVPTDRDTVLDKGFTVLADFAGRAKLSDKEIEKERGVVLEEWRLGQGAQERMRRKQFPVLFHGSLYAERLPIGKPEIIEHAPAARLRDFYRKWYTPDRMAVIAVGDLEPARLETLIRDHFASIPKAAEKSVAPVPDIPPHKETLVSVATDKEATYSSVQILYKRPRDPRGDVASFRAGLVDELFQNMMNARFSELGHKSDAPFTYAGSFDGQLGRSAEYSGFYAAVADGGIEKGLEAILTESARVREHGFLPTELDRARRDLMAGMEKAYAERDKSESRGFAGAYVQLFLAGEPAPGIEASYRLTQALLPGITLDEVTELARRRVHDENRVILATAPEKPGLTPPTEEALRAVAARVARTKVAAWKDESSGKSLMGKLEHPGTVRDRKEIPEIGATVLTLSNGVEVWLKPTKFKADEIVFSAFGLGGASLADSVRYPTASLSSMIVSEAGVGGHTSVDLEKLLAGKVVSVHTEISDYTEGLSGSCRPEDFETALQLVSLELTQPTRNPEAVPNVKKRLRTWLDNRSNSPEAVFQDSVTAINTGRFYMDRPLTQADVDALELEPALAFYRERFANAADLTFVFAGTFEVDQAAPLISRYLGALPSQGKRTSSFVPHAPELPTAVVEARVAKGVEPKSQTRITFFADAGSEELAMHRARAAASILSDRLRQRLREDLSGTYSVGAGYSGREPLRGYGTTSISFGSSPDNVKKMVAATLDEIDKLRNDGPTASDVQKEQEVERRELEVSSERNQYWMGSIQTSLMFGIDPRRVAKRRERIDLLTAENLKQTYQLLFPKDHYTVVSLFPENQTTGAKAAN
jgi:zinc protease